MDYSEALCQSMKIISESVLESVKFDKTIECTIVDDSQRAQGTYRVSDGSVEFTAYSETTTYRNNTVVYVTIPNNDYDNDKIITGKKVKGSDIEPFIYNFPFNSLVDVTGNLVPQDGNEGGLLANLPAIYYTPYYGTVDTSNYSNYYIQTDTGEFISATSANEGMYYEKNIDGASCVICEKYFDTPYTGFTRLGLQAQFQAWLQQSECAEGNYGLRLTVRFEPDVGVTQEEQDPVTKVLYLDTNDMIGNPYAFESFFNQEAVFDITNLGGISYIKLEFFQEPGTFKNTKGQEIEYLDDFGNLLLSNLFVKDCRICLGYSLDSYNTEFVQLISFDKTTYSSAAGDGANKKNIMLKWVHIDEDGNQIQMGEDSPYEYEIRWYRYILGEPSADAYSGPGWTPPTHERNVERFKISDDSFSATLIPDTALIATEQIKVILLMGTPPAYYSVDNLTKIRYERDPSNYYIKNADDTYTNCRNLTWDENQTYYEQEDDERTIYRSNIIEFQNENDVINNATLNAIQALGLSCWDVVKENDASTNSVLRQTQGNYFIYDEGNAIIDRGQSQVTRLIGCKLDLSQTPEDDTPKLFTAESITWTFPLKNTMITPLDYTVEDKNQEYGQIIITDLDKLNEYQVMYGMPVFRYKISATYSPTKSNNTISCTAVVDGVSYNASQELSFGQSGTAGTDYTFVLDFDDNIPAITLDDGEGHIGVTAYLYDSQGASQDLSNNTISWGFLDPEDSSLGFNTTKISIVTSGTAGPHSVFLDWNKSQGLSMNDVFILYATLEDFQDYELTAYLAIPIRASDEYQYLTGATQVIYLTDGNPLYYTGIYELYTKTDGLIDDELVCKAIYDNSEPDNEIYLPDVVEYKKNKVLQGYKLSPVPLFVDGLPVFGVQVTYNNAVVWTQPIVMTQNLYPSAMINKWDGKTLVMDESGGSIVGRMVGAGSKDQYGRFSGVLMGDWTENSSSGSSLGTYTGLYGFNDGEMAFSFRDDGTATIGKASAAQLIFDGNDSLIQSASFNQGNGLSIDFKNSTITAKRNNKNVMYINGTNDSTFAGDITVTGNFEYKDYNDYSVTYYNGNASIKLESVDATTSSIKLGQAIAELKQNTSYSETLTRAVQQVATKAYSAAEQASNVAKDAIEMALDISSNEGRLNKVDDAISGYFGLSSVSYNGYTNSSLKISGPGEASISIANGVHIDSGNSSSRWVCSDLTITANDVTIQYGNLRVGGKIYGTLANSSGSDRRLKHGINYNSFKNYQNLFFNLKPVEFIFNKEKSNTKSLGFIAQDILESLNSNNAIIRQDLKQPNGEYYYSLDYNSITTLNTYMLQEAYKEIDKLKQEIQELKEIISQ